MAPKTEAKIRVPRVVQVRIVTTWLGRSRRRANGASFSVASLVEDVSESEGYQSMTDSRSLVLGRVSGRLVAYAKTGGVVSNSSQVRNGPGVRVSD